MHCFHKYYDCTNVLYYYPPKYTMMTLTEVELFSLEQHCFRRLQSIINVINTNTLSDDPIITMFLVVTADSAGGT